MSGELVPGTDGALPQPGYYTDDSGRRRWWTGTGWGPSGSDERWSDADRSELLDRAIARYAQHGYTVRSRSAFRAVVAKPQRLDVLTNLLLVLITGGIWLVVLALRLLNRPVDAVVLRVDEYGALVPEFSS
jgi:hypothetical protein